MTGGGRDGRIGLEICVDSVAGARAAIAGGADRIELCAALALGGLTPSQGLVAAVLAIAGPARIPVHAMVRPRPGDFAYDADMLALASAEAAALRKQGVEGLVFGAARDGMLDVAALRAWVDGLARPEAPPALTLHRVVDLLDDPAAAVEPAIAMGFSRILTSGGAPSAPAGAATIARMVARADGRCSIMAGAGVQADNVAALIAATGIREVHGSASGAGRPEDEASSKLGFGPNPRLTDINAVARLRHVIDEITNIGQM
ncbi:hypothetical protein D9601_00440 [Sphingomonas sp. MA1305]|nr:hypothetical protein [Sphingomonas sp. MA1305]